MCETVGVDSVLRCECVLLLCSMYWNKVKVTAKRLHHEQRPGAHVDMLITEHDFMSYVTVLAP